MPSEAKVAAVEELREILKGASSIYLTDFTGMPVDMMSDLRRKCREADVEYRVVKDSLTRLAAKDAGVEQVAEFIEGPTALALGHSDQLAPARVLSQFAKEHKLPRLRAALVEGKMFNEEQVKTLAALPSRDVLLAQFAAGVMWPLNGVAGALNQAMWKLVATLDALAKSMEEGGEAAKPAETAAKEPAEDSASAAEEPGAEQKAEAGEPAAGPEGESEAGGKPEKQKGE